MSSGLAVCSTPTTSWFTLSCHLNSSTVPSTLTVIPMTNLPSKLTCTEVSKAVLLHYLLCI